MDDFNVNSLIESKNEWSSRLLNILTPTLIQGIKSVFEEAFDICKTNESEEKYLMTFQNLLNNIPKWSDETVKTETDRIITLTGCNYLEDLLACVHIIQLKSLSCARVGLKQKKIDIDIPNIYQFIHKTYINLARKIYINVYLFEKDIKPLEIQKNNRELEVITKECILNSIRESIPIENLLKQYLDETEETDITIEEKREEVIDKEAIEIERQKNMENLKSKLKEEIKEETNLLEKINIDLNKNNNIESNNNNNIEINDNNNIEDSIEIESETDFGNDETIKISDTSLNLNIDELILDNNDSESFKNEIKIEPEIDLDIEELK
jgi:hypothetical protein